jgi:predicted ester cyclase
MTIQEERKNMMRRALEDRDLALIEKNIGQNYVLHLADGTEMVGPGQYIKFVNALVAAMPDIQYKVEDIVADGDTIAIRASFTGTNTGPLRAIPPTGRKVSMREAFFFRWEGDKVVEEWSFINYMALMQQLGLAPSAGQPSG